MEPEWWEVFGVSKDSLTREEHPEYYQRRLDDIASILMRESFRMGRYGAHSERTEWMTQRLNTIEKALRDYQRELSKVGKKRDKGKSKKPDGKSHSKRVIW